MKRTAVMSVVALGILVLTQACAHQTMTFDPGSVDPAYYVKKVDQFIVIADGSTSMADRAHSEKKLSIEKSFLVSLNQTIPDLDYEGGLRVFGKGSCDTKGKTVLIRDVAEYGTAEYEGAIDSIGCIGGTSPLGKAIAASGDDLAMGRPTAVVVISDGLNMGSEAVEAAEQLKEALGDNLDIYAIQIGDEKKGNKLLNEVVAAGGDGYVKQAHELTSADAMEAFVIDVFLWPDADGDGVPDYLDKCPGTPRGVPVDETGCPIAGITVHGDEWAVHGAVLFDTDKAALKPEAKTVLDKVVDFLKKNPQFHVEIQGHTDSTGPVSWNDTLSKMRADSVMSYLVAGGIGADRLTAVGYGSSEPIASNDTAEGRHQNRRVDFKPTEK